MSEELSPERVFNDFVQIGIVVADLDQTVMVLSEVFGLGPFRITDWPPPGRENLFRAYNGEPGQFTARMAFAELGSVELEIIQPMEGRSLWSDFLEEHGPGIHHIRFNVPDMEPVLQYLAGNGIGVAQTGDGLRPGTTWANLDTDRLAGFNIEILQKLVGTDGRTPKTLDGK